MAQARKVGWELIACGPRSRAFESFRLALDEHPDALLILLVDSEDAVELSPWQHLRQRNEDGWHEPRAGEDSCHLMVQSMEAWFIADRSALKQFYDPGFQDKKLPRTAPVESIGTDKLVEALNAATRDTQAGKYHKTHHAPHLLAKIDPAKVRRASPHCERLFQTLFSHLT